MIMQIDFRWIGWMKEGTHDKVWGYFQLDNKLFCFWGRRGKALSFKDHGAAWNTYTLEKLRRQKENKGYKQTDRFQMFTIFPHFEEDVEKRLSFCMLADKVK